MGRRKRRRRANERRRKKRTYESEPVLGSDEQSESSLEISHPPLDTHIYEAKVRTSGNVNTLYIAALRGDWKTAEIALSLDKNMASIEITERGDRVLHIAASAKQTAFVHNLVERVNASDLELQNKYGFTAFCFAAVSGVVEIATVMYKKNEKLPTIRTSIGQTPLEISTLLGKRKMVEYLCSLTPIEILSAKEYMEILVAIIRNDMYGIALNMLKNRRITSPTDIELTLNVLSRKPLRGHEFQECRMWERLVSIIATIPYIPYFKSMYCTLQKRGQARQLLNVLWEQIMTLPDSDILKLIEETPLFHDAAKIGNVEFLSLLSHSYPDLLWKFDSNNYSIFHVAVINRQESVFNLIHKTGAVKDLITLYKDTEENNILHLAGKLAPPSRLNIVLGAALQMQREVQWFKEVEKIVPSSFLDMKNKDDQTPRELFSEQHTELREEGEKWMKDTASFCLVVATLIATIAFAAVFTIPGGNNEETGAPILLKDEWFTVFVISNAVAMFSSTTSIMIYLSILTSPYVEDDFLFSLPAKLSFGLISVLVSIVCMVLTFSATFFSIYNEEKQGPLRGLVAGLACLPVIIYSMLHYKFWNFRVYSTRWTAMRTFQPDELRLY